MEHYDSINYRSAADEKRKFLSRTYGWMTLALIISAASAFLTATSMPLLKFLFGHSAIGFWVVAIGEIALVWWLSASIRKISTTAASVAFVVYSVLNGLTLSSIFIVYTGTSIMYTFLASAGMFGAMSVYGMRTKQNLNSAGRYLMMAVWGLIIASLINILLKSNGLNWAISLITVVVFVGLTAYDSQKMLAAAGYADGSETFKKASIIGALELYLDFINIFLSLLRLFGRRN
ncbi:MAG: Bax inhibitor-1/YccA family protein [Treponema sp.]